MTKPNFRTVILVAALAAVTATAWAMNESSETAASTVTRAPALAQGTYVAIEEDTTVKGLEPNETLVEAPARVPAPVSAPAPAPIPVAERAELQPPVTVQTRRLTLDERIQGDVMDAILKTPNLSGKIGVESRDAVVTLTGYTTTGGMAWRAARAAGSVQGVRYVQNDIRQRIGPSI